MNDCTYTLDEARIILNAERIKENQRRRVALRYEIKRRGYGLLVLFLGIISPFVEGRDPVTGEYEFVTLVVLVFLGLVMISCPKYHEKLEEED